jgi:hypothetical protein
MARALSGKRLQISKANATMAIIVSGAAFVTIFSLVTCRSLIIQRNYQAKVISEKKKTLAQLKANNKAVEELVTSYKTFVGSSENIIGGNATGTGDRDGDNAKIVLDALPSKYDYPAVVTSLEKILTGYKINSITGTDDGLSQKDEGQDSPQVVEMPIEVNFEGSTSSVQDIISTLQRSIRPFRVTSLTLTGKDAKLVADIHVKTYYQPSKAVTITKKEVK